jgi:hypothetical protein
MVAKIGAAAASMQKQRERQLAPAHSEREALAAGS